MRRLFVALEIPRPISTDLINLKTPIPGARWVDERNLHLTLQFLGEVENDRVEELIDVLEEIQTDYFSLRLYDVGHFGSRTAPRVLWVNVEKSMALQELQSEVESLLDKNGFSIEKRKFVPHVTIARLKETHYEDLVNFTMENSLFSSDQFEITHFHLYESKISSEGPTYTKLRTFELY